MSEWKPISEAPKDGTWVYLWRDVSSYQDASPLIIGRWYGFEDDDAGPTWMWPTEPYNPFTPEGCERAMMHIESGSFYEDDSFTHYLPLSSPPIPV